MIVETARSAFPASHPRLLGMAVCGAFALGTGNNVIVMFAIALASASLLTTVGMIVPMDSFAPVTCSALGSTGMSGHEEDGAAPTWPWILLVSAAIALGGELLASTSWWEEPGSCVPQATRTTYARNGR